MKRLKARHFDKLDYEIINALKEDVRMPSAKIAEKIGAQGRTVSRRIDRLIELGAIVPTVFVVPEAFGYNCVADIGLSVDKAHYSKVLEILISSPAASYISSGSGEVNLLFQGRFRGTEEMMEYLDNIIPAMPGTTLMSYVILPKIFQNIDHWMPDGDDFEEEY